MQCTGFAGICGRQVAEPIEPKQHFRRKRQGTKGCWKYCKCIPKDETKEERLSGQRTLLKQSNRRFLIAHRVILLYSMYCSCYLCILHMCKSSCIVAFIENYLLLCLSLFVLIFLSFWLLYFAFGPLSVTCLFLSCIVYLRFNWNFQLTLYRFLVISPIHCYSYTACCSR